METIFLNRDNLAFWQEKAKQNVMALGFFDGLHYGHCKVINTALQKAREKNVLLSVMSFFPHPKTVLSGGKERVHYLMPLSEKKERLKNLGVDTFYIVRFDKEFASLLPEQFVANYLINLGVVHAVAGFDFSYGCKGAGHMDRLKIDSGGLIDGTKVEKVEHHSKKISSTLIRNMILKGNVEELPHFLGHFYEVKCHWNGATLTLYPYYTLPAPGCYVVTLKNEVGSVQTEIIITGNKEGQSLFCLTEIPSFMKGSLTIVWHRHKEEHIQTRKDKIRIS